MLASDVIQNVQDLGYGTDTAAQQLRFLNRRYHDVNGRRRWPWTEAAGTIASVIGAQTVSLTTLTDFVAVDSVSHTTTSGGRANLDFVPFKEFLELTENAPTNERGLPEVWSYANGQLYVFPTTDTVGTWNIHYKKALADLTLAQTPAWPSTYHNILTFGVAADMAARERDWDAAANWEQRYEQRILDLRHQVDQLRQRGTTEHVDESYWLGMASN